MHSFIALPLAEQQLLLNEASIRHGSMSPKILEKDLWVCLILKLLFEIDEISEYLLFKGGTSLSKSYGFIERFSEDIDLAIDIAYLGIKAEDCPAFNDTRTQREKFRKKRDKLCASIISNKILPLLKDQLTLLHITRDWSLSISEDNSHTILFQYPYSASYGTMFGKSKYGEGEYGGFGYIKPIIRLEFGARGDHLPISYTSITPYIHNILPEIFNTSIKQSISIPTLSAELTF